MTLFGRYDRIDCRPLVILTPHDGICYCPPAGVSRLSSRLSRWRKHAGRPPPEPRDGNRSRQRPASRGASSRTRAEPSKRPRTGVADGLRQRSAQPAGGSVPRPPPAAPPAPARKPTYHEAVALYERGLQAFQRRDFAAAANALRSVIEQYPDERELLERARLYLKVCERELEPKEPVPRTADEWVYAATVALNAGHESMARAAPAARAGRESAPRSRALHDGGCEHHGAETARRRSITCVTPSR